MFTKDQTKHTFKLMYSHDDAFDTGAEDFSEALERYMSVGDASVLPRRPDRDPVTYTFRYLRAREREMFERQLGLYSETPKVVYFELIARSLDEVQDAIYPDGTPVKVRVVFDAKENVRRLDEDSLDLLQRADAALQKEGKPSLLAELGMRAFSENYGNPT